MDRGSEGQTEGIVAEGRCLPIRANLARVGLAPTQQYICSDPAEEPHRLCTNVAKSRDAFRRVTRHKTGCPGWSSGQDENPSTGSGRRPRQAEATNYQRL